LIGRRCFAIWSRVGRSTSIAAAARADYVGKLAAHGAAVSAICEKLGIAYHRLTTDQPLELALYELLQRRLRRKTTARASVSDPLFLLGGLALALPVIFHLIRRTTRERARVQFAHVFAAHAAAADQAQSAGAPGCCCCCAVSPSRCWRWDLPGRS